MKNTQQITFKMMARAINQLGEQLIKSESVALLGLIKMRMMQTQLIAVLF